MNNDAAEMFAEHCLARNIAYSCDDTLALISLMSAILALALALALLPMEEGFLKAQFQASHGEGWWIQHRHVECLEQEGSNVFGYRYPRYRQLADPSAKTPNIRTLAMSVSSHSAAAKAPGGR